MIKVSITGAKELSAKLSKAARVELRESIMNGVEAGARRAEKHVKEVELSGGSLNVRSGHLRKSVHVKLDRADMSARVGTTTIYARPHEEGAVITPKKAKVLAIPLKAALTRGGRSRGGPRNFTGFWRGREGRNPIFFGTGGPRLVALFVGVQRVKLKARRPFGKTVQATNRGIVRVMNDTIKKALP